MTKRVASESEWAARPLAELKRLCREYGIASSGTKDELAARLSGASTSTTSFSFSSSSTRTPTSLKELKDRCRAAALSVAGTRAELAERLAAYERTQSGGKKKEPFSRPGVPSKPLASSTTAVSGGELRAELERSSTTTRPDLKNTYDELTVPELKERCAKLKLQVGGPKEKLIARLRLSVLTIAELSEIARKVGVAVGDKRAQHIEKLSVTDVREWALAELPHVPPRPKVVRQRYKAPTKEELAEAAADEAKRVEEKRALSRRFKQSMSSSASSESQVPPSFPRPIVPSSRANAVASFVVYNVAAPSRNTDSPSIGFSRVFSTKDGANAQVRRVFFEEHPGGWTPRDFAENASAVKESYDDGQLTISLQAPHKLWTVSSTCVPASSSLVPKIREPYLVLSWQSYLALNQSLCVPKVTFYKLDDKKEDANALVEKLFYEENPWGFPRHQLDGRSSGLRRDTRDGALSLSKIRGSGENWHVDVVRVGGGEVPAAEEWFLVFTKNICHVTGDPYYEISRLLKTREETNKLASQTFYQRNPWGWSREDFETRSVKVAREDGMLGLSIRFEGEWTVCAMEIPFGSQLSASKPAILVASTTGYNPESFRPREKLTLIVERLVSTKTIADKEVEDIFYNRNPYSWTRDEFHEKTPYYYDPPQIKKEEKQGFMSMSISPPKKETWKVFAIPLSGDTTLNDGFNWTTLATGRAPPSVKPSHVAAVAARREEEAKAAKKPRPSANRPWFLAYSFYEKFPYEGPTYEFFPLFTSKEDANAHVKHVFYKQNPWGWKDEDFKGSATRVKRSHVDGLMKLSMDDEEEWTVRVIQVPAGSDVPADDPTAAIVIHSAFGYRPDGFHAPMRQTLKIEAVMPSKEAANARVKEIFLKNHSYEWSIKELTSRSYGGGADIEKEHEKGLLSMTIHPADDESWSVYAQAVKKPRSEFRAMGAYFIPEGYESQDDQDDSVGYRGGF